MDSIYRQARDVIIWLGTGFSGSDELTSYVNLASSNMSMHMQPELFEYWAKLVQIPYWTRLWICQEVILAKMITIWIGKSRIVWGQFQHHADENDLLTSISQRAGAERGAGCLRRLVDGRMRQNDEPARGEMSWRAALAVQKGSACFLQHDRIFGLLGLVKEELKIDVDYKIPMRTLFYKVLDKHMADDARHHPWNLAWIPHLNSLAYFVKDLRYEMGLKKEITDTELATYLRETLQASLHDFSKLAGWREVAKYPWKARRVQNWSKTFPNIGYIEGCDWNNYNAQPDDWKAIVPEELHTAVIEQARQ